MTKRLSDEEKRRRERERHRKQQSAWAKENPECIAESQLRWKQKQEPDLLRQYGRDAYAANPEPRKARALAHYYANREAILAKRRAKQA